MMSFVLIGSLLAASDSAVHGRLFVDARHLVEDTTGADAGLVALDVPFPPPIRTSSRLLRDREVREDLDPD